MNAESEDNYLTASADDGFHSDISAIGMRRFIMNLPTQMFLHRVLRQWRTFATCFFWLIDPYVKAVKMKYFKFWELFQDFIDLI